MLPIGDSPRDPSHVPGVTLALVWLNVLAGLFTFPLIFQAWSPGDIGYDWMLGNVPSGWAPPFSGYALLIWTLGFRPDQPGLLTSVTSMFLHGGMLHLAGNMLYLWIYGPNVERRLGRVGFLLLYVTSGILGNVLYALVSLGSDTPVVGASGAISGLLGAYLVFYPRNKIKLLLPPITVPAWLVLWFYLVVYNLWPFLSGSTSVVAHAVHLGGFFAGALLALGLSVLDPPVERVRHQTSSAQAELGRARQLWRDGRLLDAHRVLTQLASPGQPRQVADVALRELEQLEIDPAYQRAAFRAVR